MGTRVINNMIDVVTANSTASLHELYFDSFLTNYNLISDLAKIGVRATATIRETSTTGANQKMISSKQLHKKSVGVLIIAVMRLFMLPSGVTTR